MYNAGHCVSCWKGCAESHSSLVCSRGYAAAVYSVGMLQQLFLCVETWLGIHLENPQYSNRKTILKVSQNAHYPCSKKAKKAVGPQVSDTMMKFEVFQQEIAKLIHLFTTLKELHVIK